jgi:hypothetical protein
MRPQERQPWASAPSPREWAAGESPLLTNHGTIDVWNLLAGDTVIIDGLLATVHTDPVTADGKATIQFLVYEIIENEETTTLGDWWAQPRIHTVTLPDTYPLPLLQRHEVTSFKSVQL